jgi:hypothetical protein
MRDFYLPEWRLPRISARSRDQSLLEIADCPSVSERPQFQPHLVDGLQVRTDLVFTATVYACQV